MMVLPATISTPEGLSVEGASAELLAALLDEYGSELRKRGVPVEVGLAPGLPAAQTRAEFQKVGLTAPREVEVWYAWQNGALAIEGRGLWLLPIIEAWSVRSTIDWYLWQTHGTEVWEWHPQWVKIAGEKHGMAAFFSGDSERSPLVRSVGWGEGMQPGSPPTQVVSLCTVVAWWIDGLRTNRYIWDRETWTWTEALTVGVDERDVTELY